MQKSIHIDYQDNLSVEKKLLLQAALGDEALCLTAWHDWKIRRANASYPSKTLRR
jgi:hypothetical protein